MMDKMYIYWIIFLVEIIFVGVGGIVAESLYKHNSEESEDVFLITQNLSKIIVIILASVCWIIMHETNYNFDYDIILKPKKPWQFIEMIGGIILFCAIAFAIFKSGDGQINKMVLIVLFIVLVQLYYIIKNKSEYDKKNK
jgi:hypothetical protein